MIARANSIWVFMDLEKGRPARPTAEHIEPYGTCEPLDMPYEGRKDRAAGARRGGRALPGAEISH